MCIVCTHPWVQPAAADIDGSGISSPGRESADPVAVEKLAAELLHELERVVAHAEAGDIRKLDLKRARQTISRNSHLLRVLSQCYTDLEEVD